MNGIALFNALTKIDDRFIDRAERGPDGAERTASRRPLPRRSVRRWAIIAECACLLLTVSLILFRLIGPFGSKERPKPSNNYMAGVSAASVADAPVTQAATQGWSQAGTEGTAATHELNTRFTLSKVDGRNYLNFDGGNASYSSIKGIVYFETVDAMVTAIRTNSLSPAQCETIRNSFPRDENGIRIIDVDHVCDPLLPDELTVRGVDWEGPSYLFPFDDENNVTGYLNVLSPEDYATVFAKEYAEFFNREQITVTSRRRTGDRNAEVVLFSTSSADQKRIRYTLPNGVIVDEQYVLKSNTPLLETSETIPQKILLYHEGEECCFTAVIFGLTERPSVEWLSQFGLAAR